MTQSQQPLPRSRLLVGLIAGLTVLCGLAQAAPLSLSVDDRTGLPRLSKGGDAMTSSYAFWGSNWAWADQSTKFSTLGTFDYAFSGSNDTLGLASTGSIRRSSPQALTWRWAFNARSPLRNVIGGGIVFHFDLTAFGRELGEPELLPGNRGWSWGRAGAERVEVRFDPPMASVYFEQGRKNSIRAFFYKDTIGVEPLVHTATVTMSAAGAIQPTSAERFGLQRVASWPTHSVDTYSAPIDLSFLNEGDRPAGKRGFVKAIDDRLVFEDGTPARFWGTNLTAYTLFTTPRDAVRRHARRLARLGYNLVRIHHHDSPWVTPNIFGTDKTPDTGSLNAESLARIDWWVKCLRDEGIYIWLDLHVQRAFKPADNITWYQEMPRKDGGADLKGFNYVNPSIQAAMNRFAEAYLDHVNPHTGLRYAQDPAVMGVLLSNENDLTHHFGNALLPDKRVPQHNAAYTAAADKFAAATGLPKDKVWRSWEHGPSKLFLNDLEYAVQRSLLERLRARGLRAPVASTNAWGDAPLSSLPALTAGDVIDAHAYGTANELERDPLVKATMVHWLAAAQVAGKPMTVTEWNLGSFPEPDRHGMPLYVAASAAHQGWDAMMVYAYAQEGLDGGPGSLSHWHTYNDPALLASLAAGALLFRQAHVREATSVYAYSPSRDTLFNQLVSPDTSAALRTATERGKLVIVLPAVRELPWLKAGTAPAGAHIVRDASAPQIAPGSAEAVSDNGELRRNWERGLFTVSTPRTQLATGWVGGQPIVLPDVEVALSTLHASVAVQSLDDKPINASKSLLISLGSVSMPVRPNQLPLSSEPLVGKITIRAVPGLKLFALQGKEGDGRAVLAPYADGKYSLVLDGKVNATWLQLRAP